MGSASHGTTDANRYDIWVFRFAWATEKSHIQHDLLTGSYRFEPLSMLTNGNGELLHLCSAQYALALKALTVVLRKRLPASQRCLHVKGHSGAKATLQAVREQPPRHRFVIKTDIRYYYTSIDLAVLLEQLTDDHYYLKYKMLTH